MWHLVKRIFIDFKNSLALNHKNLLIHFMKIIQIVVKKVGPS